MATSTVLSSRANLLHVAAHPYTLLSSHRARRPVRCSSSSPEPAAHRRSRRTASIALLVLHFVSSRPDLALAGPFDRYVKRKKLDPLEAYVPAVLLTQAQFEDLEKTLDLEQPKYDFGRSLLRSGPAASLRVNIRAVSLMQRLRLPPCDWEVTGLNLETTTPHAWIPMWNHEQPLEAL